MEWSFAYCAQWGVGKGGGKAIASAKGGGKAIVSAKGGGKNGKDPACVPAGTVAGHGVAIPGHKNFFLPMPFHSPVRDVYMSSLLPFERPLSNPSNVLLAVYRLKLKLVSITLVNA